MSDNSSDRNPARISISWFGVTIVFQPRSLTDWMVGVVIALAIGFSAYMFIGDESVRRELAQWIYSPPAASPNVDVKTSPPPKTATARKENIDTDLRIHVEPSENRLSVDPAITSSPPLPMRKHYRVRKTDALADKPFAYLPLRIAPDPDSDVIKKLLPGTEYIYPTGQEKIIYGQAYLRWLNIGMKVKWVQVRHEDDTGWVSSPYIEVAK